MTAPTPSLAERLADLHDQEERLVAVHLEADTAAAAQLATTQSDLAAARTRIADLEAQLAAQQPPAPPPWTPPVGPSAALYEDPPPFAPGLPDVPMSFYSKLWRPGDTVADVRRKAAPLTLLVLDVDEVVTPPDFAMPDSAAWQFGPETGPQLLGLAGLGEGKTRITMPAMSSPSRYNRTSGTTPYRVLKLTDRSDSGSKRVPLMYVGGFTLDCTAQGPDGRLMFHGITLWRPNADEIRVGDLAVNGWSGAGGAPPKECFGLETGARDRKTKVRYARLHMDARRGDGVAWGAVGWTMQDVGDGVVYDSTSRGQCASSAVAFQSDRIRYYRCLLGAVDENATPGPGKKVSGSFNAEQCPDVALFDCSFAVHRSMGAEGIHVTFSNGVKDGRLRVVGEPRWNDSGVTPAGTLHVTSWIDRGIIDYSTGVQKSPPVVLDTAGKATPKADWRRGAPVVWRQG